MTVNELEYCVIDSILEFVGRYGTCEVEPDFDKLRHEAKKNYDKSITVEDEQTLRGYVTKFNETYSRWDDIISSDIEASGSSTIYGKEIDVSDSQLSEQANDFIHRFIIAILQAKFGSSLKIIR